VLPTRASNSTGVAALMPASPQTTLCVTADQSTAPGGYAASQVQKPSPGPGHIILLIFTQPEVTYGATGYGPVTTDRSRTVSASVLRCLCAITRASMARSPSNSSTQPACSGPLLDDQQDCLDASNTVCFSVSCIQSLSSAGLSDNNAH
jgi:hypothetical protein